MKNHSAMTICLMLTAGLVCRPDAAVAGRHPEIACKEPVFLFGSRPSTTEVAHVFVVLNNGDAPLEIVNVRTGCGCASAVVTNRSVPPGGETTVDVRLNLNGRLGIQRKSIYVGSNDPATPLFRLELTGEALATATPAGAGAAATGGGDAPPLDVAVSAPPDLYATPGELVLVAPAAAKGAAVRYVAVRSRSNSPFHVRAVKVTAPGVAAETQGGAGPDGVLVRVTGLVPTEGLDGQSIYVMSDVPRPAVVRIPIRVLRPAVVGVARDTPVSDRRSGAGQ